MAIIWITHDLGVVAGLAQRVMVMYGGYIIEEAAVKELYANPSHPYTIGLIRSLPRVDAGPDAAACVPSSPPRERCNAVDDDCNGLIDEGLPYAPIAPAFALRTIEER